jgi:hypothetical protein
LAWQGASAQSAPTAASPAPQASAAAAKPPTPPACSAPEYRQFDFWVGDWDVHTADGKAAGRNIITRIAGGCALHENWAGRGGFTGQSLNGWNSATRQWQQTWLDSSGSRLELSGGLQGTSMVLAGVTPNPSKAGTSLRHRITWTPLPEGRVRQHWETSEDEGRTWSSAFDGIYKRRP